MKELDLSVIILCFNEEIHIKRCLDKVCDIAKDVFLVDCYSTDKTLDIAKSYSKVHILQHEWENSYSKQFNWALENCPIRTKWVLRLDADEYLTEELKKEMCIKLPVLPEDITGCSIFLRRVFLGKVIRRGMPKIKQMRLFVYGAAQCEMRLMDEHIQLLRGKMIDFEGEFADDNLNDLSWWTKKHVGYAIREAVDLLDIEYDLLGVAKDDCDKILTKDAHVKRMKKHSYAKQPLFWRSFAYFCYRYFFKFGFIEGKEAFLWHFLQGWWYRTLCDAKVYEIKKACGNDREKIKIHLKKHYGINI